MSSGRMSTRLRSKNSSRASSLLSESSEKEQQRDLVLPSETTPEVIPSRGKVSNSKKQVSESSQEQTKKKSGVEKKQRKKGGTAKSIKEKDEKEPEKEPEKKKNGLDVFLDHLRKLESEGKVVLVKFVSVDDEYEIVEPTPDNLLPNSAVIDDYSSSTCLQPGDLVVAKSETNDRMYEAEIFQICASREEGRSRFQQRMRQLEKMRAADKRRSEFGNSKTASKKSRQDDAAEHTASGDEATGNGIGRNPSPQQAVQSRDQTSANGPNTSNATISEFGQQKNVPISGAESSMEPKDTSPATSEFGQLSRDSSVDPGPSTSNGGDGTANGAANVLGSFSSVPRSAKKSTVFIPSTSSPSLPVRVVQRRTAPQQEFPNSDIVIVPDSENVKFAWETFVPGKVSLMKQPYAGLQVYVCQVKINHLKRNKPAKQKYLRTLFKILFGLDGLVELERRRRRELLMNMDSQCGPVTLLGEEFMSTLTDHLQEMGFNETDWISPTIGSIMYDFRRKEKRQAEKMTKKAQS